jgi:hypothetical protein
VGARGLFLAAGLPHFSSLFPPVTAYNLMAVIMEREKKERHWPSAECGLISFNERKRIIKSSGYLEWLIGFDLRAGDALQVSLSTPFSHFISYRSSVEWMPTAVELNCKKKRLIGFPSDIQTVGAHVRTSRAQRGRKERERIIQKAEMDNSSALTMDSSTFLM